MIDNELLDIDPIKDAPLSPSIAVSALAMNFALKWYDLTWIKDGTLYQQKKMEGVNFVLVDIPDVMALAQKFEAWLLSGENRQVEMLRSGIIQQFVGNAIDMIGEAIDAQETEAGADEIEGGAEGAPG